MEEILLFFMSFNGIMMILHFGKYSLKYHIAMLNSILSLEQLFSQVAVLSNLGLEQRMV